MKKNSSTWKADAIKENSNLFFGKKAVSFKHNGCAYLQKIEVIHKN